MNNREFKFRVWDGYDYVSNVVLFPEDDGTFLPRKIGQYSYFEDMPHAVVQQYIGIKDSLGYPIYEGDIVSLQLRSNKNPHKVIYDHGLCMFYLLNKKGMPIEIDGIISPICGIDVRIIGNIFENPDLMKI